METNIKIQNQKLELIQWLLTLQDSSVIQKITELRNAEYIEFFDSLSELEKESIASGIADADAGKVSSHFTARKIYEKYL